MQYRLGAPVALAKSALALLVLGLSVGLGPLPTDAADEVLASLRERGAGAPLLAAADIAGSLPVWAAAIVLIALALARRGPRLAGESVRLSVLGEVAATILKVIVARPHLPGGRP